MPLNFPALEAARRHDAGARVPFLIDGAEVGSVARAHLAALRAAPPGLRVDAAGVWLDVPTAQRDAALAAVNVHLRATGLLRGWRDETFPVVDPRPGPHRTLARIERAAARFFGTLTAGAHANGWVAGADGRPSHLWIARRAANKSTDPGLLDNLVGGGVPEGQTPWQALLRESWEEAGLSEAEATRAQPAGVLRVKRETAHGLQFEDLHAHDLLLPEGLVPRNQDGEVQDFLCMPVKEALAVAAGGEMTVDAALVTLDFGVRHGVLPQGEGWDRGALAAALDALRPPQNSAP